VLIEALDSEDRRRRYYAVFFLGKLGPVAAEALPALRQALESESQRFREVVQRTIDSIEGKTDDAEE
jgi:HEAT repeat protein